MPREARRITLEITYIKVERLQEITPGEAVLEGIESEGIGFKAYRKIHSRTTQRRTSPLEQRT